MMENVVIARNLLIGMIKMARRKAMSIYNTPYISFISEKESWKDCIDVTMVAEDAFFILLHFNVGELSHAVGYTYEGGNLQLVWS